MPRRILISLFTVSILLSRPACAARPDVDIQGPGLPSTAVQAVRTAVGLIAALADDQDGGESARLQRRARDAAVTALATEGYFSAQVEITAGGDSEHPSWTLAITPGERTTIASVDLEFAGTITEPVFADRIEALRNGWELKQGSPFRNDVWETAKRNLLDAAGERDFPAARLLESSASVDADHASAALRVRLDSGPAVRLGKVEVRGLKRIPPGVAERYLRIEPGEPYDRTRMVDRQQALQRAPFFSGAKLDVDRSYIASAPTEQPALLPEGLKDEAQTATHPAYQGPPQLTVPVLADVVESRPQRMTAAVGVDDDAGPHGETVYRRNMLGSWPVELESGAHLDRLRQLGYADLHLAPNEHGYLDSLGLLAQHSTIQGLTVHGVALGAIRVKNYPASPGTRVEHEIRYGARVAYELHQLEDGPSFNASAVTGTVQYTRRDVNDKYDPRDGNLISLGAGIGNALQGDNPFGRLSVRGQYWWSPTKRDVLTVRAEAGRVFARDLNRVPDDFAFRTGGARTLRGYSYLGLGRHVGNAILGDAAMFVASVEGTHYFDDRFGGALFVDTGDVASGFGAMSLKTSVGTGVRVRTPAGPLNVDLAYPLQGDGGIHLHFSLGIAF